MKKTQHGRLKLLVLFPRSRLYLLIFIYIYIYISPSISFNFFSLFKTGLAFRVDIQAIWNSNTNIMYGL